ncbi:hypothetical protein BDV32DRAFT_154598 [Aspergillus pseudonomiae]|nr:hypothetical protein BDV32DRAFT_154598 [Aspergillus pseudonomiae]
MRNTNPMSVMDGTPQPLLQPTALDSVDESLKERKPDNHGHDVSDQGPKYSTNSQNRHATDMHMDNHLVVNNDITPGHSINCHIDQISGHARRDEAVLNFQLPLPTGNPGSTAATLCAAALAIVLASHTDSTEFAFTVVPDVQRPLQSSWKECSAEGLTPDSSFCIVVAWESDLQDFLQSVQDRLPDPTILRMQHDSMALPRSLGARTLDLQTKDGSTGLHHRALLVDCTLHADELQLSFLIDSAAVDPQLINHVSWQYESILRRLLSAGSDRGERLSNFRVVNMQDLREIWRWNSAVPERVDGLVHDIFAGVVRAQPESPAICAHDGELTYGELDHLSTHLAQSLMKYGVKDTIVPLHLEKSMWTPVAQLGVMKAGAASVVLDVSQPVERLRTILRQVNPRLVLTSVENEAVTRRLSTEPVMVVGKAASAQLPQAEAECVLPAVAPSAQLYIVFTSGSTGVPKGAIVTHSNFASAIRHQQRALQFRAGQRVFDFASYAFDVAWSNFLHTITAGGCLCIPSDQERKQDIPGALRKYRAEYAHLTPSVTWFSPEDLPESIQFLQFSGEELKASLVQAFHTRATIINTYGPAECSVTSTIQAVDTSMADRNPPIGHGLGSCTWVVSLDGAQLAPIGTVGELWIEGPIVGGGYLNDPKKTEAAFIEDPAWLLRRGFTTTQPGRRGRLYRTGDLVRYNRHDGSLSFVGRKDSQVKIRGQRVELADVEHHLRNCLPFELQKRLQVISEVIVPHGSTNPALVVLVNSVDDTIHSDMATFVRKAAGVWDEKLAESVPTYMIPSAYIPLKRFPMTATGKTDRRRLREAASKMFWEHAIPDGDAERMQPTSEEEQDMLEVWSEVLNIPPNKISTDAAFTRLGGDSITAMQVVSRCRERKVHVTVGDVLKLRTIRALAAQRKATSPTTAIVASEDDAEGRSWPLSPMQQLFFDAHPAGLNHYTQSFLLRVTRPLSFHALREALATIVQRHGMLRVRFQRRRDTQTWEQVVVRAEDNAFVVVEHPARPPGGLESVVQARQESLDLQKGPVFAADLFGGSGEEDASLLLSAHHVVIDLVSWRVIWHELETCLTRGPAKLPSAPLSFQTWCRLQRTEGNTLDPTAVLPYPVEAAQMSYWGLDPKDNRFAESDLYEHTIDTETTALLLGRSNHNLRTETLDILVGALVHSFRQAFPDRTAPAVFLEGHGREPLMGTDVDLAETVGWFTTLHPVPVSGSRSDSLVDSIRQAKDTRARVPGKGRPYIACRYHSAAGRQAFTHHQPVELLLNYRGVFQQLETAGTLLQREDRPNRTVAIREFGDNYQRMALVEINIVVEAGRARISTTTHRRMRHRGRLHRWIQHLFPDALRAASQDLLAIRSSPTLSDFPLLSISYAGLEALLTGQLAARGITTEAVRDIYPCTPVQEGILLSEKKGAASYRNSWIWRCSSGLQPSPVVSLECLAAAWKTVVCKHSIFATVFASHPDTGRDIQVLLDGIEPRVVSMTPAVTSQSATQYLLNMNPPTMMSSSPEYRVTVCQDPDGEVACRLDMSHALIDAASIPVLMRDLATVYAGGRWGNRPDPPPFSNVVSHVEASLSSSNRLAYWQAHLKDAQQCEIVGDLLPVQAERAKGCQLYGLIPLRQATTTAISSYCRKHDVTRAVFLEVAWALVLAQFTGMTEVCFGYVCSGRDTPVEGVEAIVGPLISMLVARIDLSASQLMDILHTVGEQSIEHLNHQHTSLAEIQHAMGRRGALFNTAITVREAHRYGCEDGLQLEEIREEDPHEFDLLLSATLDGVETEISIQYRGDYMSVGLASMIAGALESAIAYLVGYQNADSSKRPVYDSYFEHISGIDEYSAMSHWNSQFAGLDGITFPPLPSPSYRPKVGAAVQHMVHDITWPDSYPAASLIRAAWASVQAAHTNSDDVWFGTISCKGLPTSPAMATAPPMRVTLDRDEKVVDLLERIHTESMRSANLNILRIQRLGEGAARACRFQTLLAIVTSGPGPETVQDDRLVGGNEHNLLPSRPLVLSIQSILGPSNVQLRANFDPGVLEGDLAAKMLRQFECALRWLSTPAHVGRAIRDVETASEHDLRIIWTLNQVVPKSMNLLVHDLFARTVQRQPTALAISAWDGELTYQALDDLSTRLALHLIEQGVRPGIIIPIYIEKSMWVPVAQIAVMKAGGASVLLDSTQPFERARSIASQVQPNVVISSPANRLSVSSLICPNLLILDWSLVKTIPYMAPGQSLPRTAVPSDLLYVVFTSGSTGVPKGAMITHENFASAAHYQQRALGYAPGVRVYDFVSYAFDVTWSNMLHSLTSGACLCIPSDEQRKNNLLGSLQASQATLVDLTPSILRLLQPKQLPQLRRVILSGESFSQASLGDWASHTGLLNTYGPAECSVKATMAPVRGSSCENNIGCGEGLVTWVVDANNPDKLAPLGAVGELWLEGPLVGQGYLGDAEKTAAAFVKDPPWLLRGGPGCPGRRGRLYRTGDMVRYECNGDSGRLTFIGRKDSQIKIRGQRVELGEIEYHVQNSLVTEGSTQVQVLADVLQPRDSTHPMLVAFVCVSKGDKSTALKLTAGLDDKLTDKLPAYMIPTAYIPVDRMPVGPTGKTDRRRLREMGAALTLKQLSELQPRRGRDRISSCRDSLSPTEALLLETWAVVLEVNANHLSPHDHFLRVGGDSILAMRLIGEARERGMSLSVADVFRWPRLVDLARELDGRSNVLLQPTLKQPSVKSFSLLSGNAVPEEVQARAASLCGIEADQVEDVFPCTPLQAGLLAETVRRPGDNVLREKWWLKKSVDVGRMRAAWQRVVRANTILRTRIVDLGQQGLVQVIVRHDEGCEMRQGTSEQDFGLGTPLVLYDISESCFSWEVHHALYDGWSMSLIFDALDKSYRSETIPIAPPFQAFIEYVKNSSQSQAQEFWKDQFRDFDAQKFPVLPCPAYRPKCDERLELDIDDVAPNGEYTASTRIRLAWAILLSTITSSADASFGAIVSGRQANVPGIERMTGPTMATVPLRVAIDRSKAVRDLLQQVQIQAAEMMLFEQVGLQQIRRFSEDCNLGCQFQSLMVIQSRLEHDAKGALFESAPVATAVDDVDPFKLYAICLEFVLRPNSVGLRADYDSTVVSPTQFRRLADRFQNIFMQLSLPWVQAQPLSLLDTSSLGDLEQIWRWNDTTLERCGETVHEIFSQVAARQPDAAAVCSWDGNFTYGQVEELSTRIAHELLRAGLPQSGQRIVPLMFEKSKWTSVCQIAVMKANATSVALDTTLPDGRVQTVIDLAKPQIILTLAAQESRARSLVPSTARIIVVSDAQEPAFIRPQDAQLPAVDPDTWLYVVFTSGSTGIPKGAIISHSNFTSALKHGQTALKFGPHTRAYDFVSYAFDVSWLNVLYTLCAGGCLCVPSQHEIQNEPKEAIARRQANTAFITPTVGKLLHGADLQVINYGGENLPRDEIHYWKDRAQIIHSYGPSECTPISISHILDPARSRVIIGKGLGVRTWIVEPEHGHSLAAIGDIGELWLEGPLVGQGYLNEPEKTAASFIEDPKWLIQGGPGFAGRQGRLYRTGDLVRYEEDGNLEFIGRKDAQIKIRGQRVELEEIGHHVFDAITETTVSQVVVDIVKLADSGEWVLVAFIKPTDKGILPGTPEARAYTQHLAASTKARLSATIPSYMIPNAYLLVDSIPNTTSGKVDRGKLRKAASSMHKEDLLQVDSIERRAPETAAERKLHTLVAQVLSWDQESFGMDSNFIQLGGDSISAMRLASLAREQAISLTVANILTKAHIADLLETDQETGLDNVNETSRFALLDAADSRAFVQGQVMPHVQSGHGKLIDVLPATDMQSTYLRDNLHEPRRSWFYSYIDFSRIPDKHLLVQSCEQVVAHCDIYRTAFVRSGESFLQAVFDSWAPTIDIVDDVDVEAAFEKLVEEEVKTPARLGAPLIQFTLICGQNGIARLVFSKSHAIYDAISISQTLQMLAEAYNGSTHESQSFRRYVHHIQLQKDESYAYWRKTLQNSSMTRIPCTSTDSTKEGPPTVLERSIQMPTPPFGITQASLFTLACAAALSRLTGSSDVIFGRVVSGRASVPAELQNVIGPCLNRLPVRVQFASGQTKMERLATLQKQQAQSLAHETMGLADIVKHCTDWPADTKDFGCWIQYQNVDEAPVLSVPGAVGRLAHKEMWHVPVAADFLEIFAIPRGDGTLTVRLIGGLGYVEAVKVALLEGLCFELEDAV